MKLRNHGASLAEVRENRRVRERYELMTISLVELVLKFNPMKTQGVKEALHYVHAHEYEQGE